MRQLANLRRLALPLLLLLLAVSLTACGGTAVAQAAKTATPAPAKPATVAAPTATPEPAAAPAAETPAEAEGPVTYHAILPSATSPAQVVALTLNPDGTASLNTDLLDGNPAKVETGTWTSDDGSLTVTLEAVDGKAYDEPVTITVTSEGDVVSISRSDDERSAAAPVKLEKRGDQGLFVAEVKRSFIDVDAQAGFSLDPFFVSVSGGGELDATNLTGDCEGYISPEPAVSIDWSGKAEFARVFVYSDEDTTLVVQKPDGSYICGDDTGTLVLDPVIDVENPTEGRYNIWVGGFSRNQLVPAILVLTGKKDIDPTNFDLTTLVKRPPMMQSLALPQRSISAETLTQPSLRSRVAGAVAQLKAARAELRQKVTAEGMVPAFDIETPGLICNGFIAEEPDFTFEWTATSEELHVLFEGDSDATLLVVGPDGAIVCNDDAASGANVNPRVVVADPQEGEYKVFVGRVNPEKPVKGDIVVTGAAKPDHKILAPVEPTPAPEN